MESMEARASRDTARFGTYVLIFVRPILMDASFLRSSSMGLFSMVLILVDWSFAMLTLVEHISLTLYSRTVTSKTSILTTPLWDGQSSEMSI